MTMPTAERYAELTTSLGRIARRFEAADKDDDDDRKARLIAGIEALRDVILYLQADCDVRTAALTRPLGEIENALHNASRGADPPLLDHAPDGAGSKPSGEMREHVQGVIVAAVHMLKLGNWSTERAAREVARLAERARIRCVDGTPIFARQVRNWHSEYSKGGLPAGARVTFEIFDGYERAKPWFRLPRSHPNKRPEAERAACEIIASLTAIAPRAAPPPTKRLKQ